MRFEGNSKFSTSFFKSVFLLLFFSTRAADRDNGGVQRGYHVMFIKELALPYLSVLYV